MNPLHPSPRLAVPTMSPPGLAVPPMSHPLAWLSPPAWLPLSCPPPSLAVPPCPPSPLLTIDEDGHEVPGWQGQGGGQDQHPELGGHREVTS